MSKSNNIHKWILLSHFAIILYYLPYFFLGENSNVLIHDNLDSNIVWVKILLQNGLDFAHPMDFYDGVLGGVRVYQIYGTYDISLVIFKCFGILYGYLVNKLMIAFIGFWGMYLLLSKHFLTSDEKRHISVGIAIVFALLPFWSFMATVQGLPFVLWAFFNLRKGQYLIYNYLVIGLFALYSSLVLSGIFLVFFLGVQFLVDSWKKKKVNLHYVIGFVVLGTGYLISHFPMICGLLTDISISHRTEIVKNSIDLKTAFHHSKRVFLEGQYHASSLHEFFVLPLVITVIFWPKMWNKHAVLLVVFIALTSLFYGFQHYEGLKPYIELLTAHLPLQLQRFHFLHPVFWYVILAIALRKVDRYVKWGTGIVVAVLFFQLGFVVMNHELITNYEKPSFKQFYAEGTFEKIKNKIEEPLDSVKFITVGMHPAIAQYNGLKTLDGYFPNYPLKHKHSFRVIIGNELQKNESLRTYFDEWGSRCYAFSAELGKEFMNNQNDTIKNLNFDYEHFKSMGGTHILSSTPIAESSKNGIKLMDVFHEDNQYWSIYLFKVR